MRERERHLAQARAGQALERLRLGGEERVPHRRRAHRFEQLDRAARERRGDLRIDLTARALRDHPRDHALSLEAALHLDAKRDVHHARRQLDLRALEPARVALAVEALVDLPEREHHALAHAQARGELDRQIAVRRRELLRQRGIEHHPRDRARARPLDRVAEHVGDARPVGRRQRAQQPQIVASAHPRGLVRERGAADEPQQRRVIDVLQLGPTSAELAADLDRQHTRAQRGLQPEAGGQIGRQRQSSHQLRQSRLVPHPSPAIPLVRCVTQTAT